jgi:colicin import membrane protein
MKARLFMIWALSVATGALSQAQQAQGQEKAVAASAPTVQQQRAQIQQLKAEHEARSAAEEAACQTRFAVTGCVTDARRRRREVMADLNRQEGLLNSQERKAKGGDQLIRLEEKAGRLSDRVASQPPAGGEVAAQEPVLNPGEKASQPKAAKLPKQAPIPAVPTAAPANKSPNATGNAAYRALQEKKYNEKIQAAEERRKKKAAALAAKSAKPPQHLPTP